MSGYSVAISGNVPTNVATSYETNSGTATPAANVLGIIGAGGTTTSGSGNTIIVTSTADVMSWTDESVSFAAAANNGYFCDASLTVTLPAGAAQGNLISIVCTTSDAVTIQADATQFIAIGAETSTMGGTAVSTAQGDNLILIYKNTTSTWWALEADATWLLN